MTGASRRYWNDIARRYQDETRILTTDFHYGPLIPGYRTLRLLPAELAGARCLEAGCGAGQNSIFLAGRGACCTAFDIAEGQLAAGRRLARAAGCRVHWLQGELAAPPFRRGATFDLVHSCYALPFTADPETAVRRLADLVAPGGRLILSTAHPAAAGEWLELDGECGIFLADYFAPPPERRQTPDGTEILCRAVPLSMIFAWLRAAGLTVTALLEPRPPGPEDLFDTAGNPRVPYWSDAWLEHYEELRRVPFTAVFAAER
jgi:SAM-dependent methyltransferase